MAVGRWRVEGSHDNLWLVQRSRWGGELHAALEGKGEALNGDAAAFQVDTWFPDGWGDAAGASTLADIAAALGEELLWNHDGDARRRLKSLVRQALREGRLVALRVSLPVPAGGVVEQEERAPAERGPRKEETAWIEIVLSTDDDPPRPMAFKRYRVELPDGSVRDGQLDSRGMARLVGIDPGTCQVSFPDYDGKRWRRA